MRHLADTAVLFNTVFAFFFLLHCVLAILKYFYKWKNCTFVSPWLLQRVAVVSMATVCVVAVGTAAAGAAPARPTAAVEGRVWSESDVQVKHTGIDCLNAEMFYW